QLLARRGELRRLQLNLGEHRAQSRALFLGRRDERLQFIRLNLRRSTLLECVEHTDFLPGVRCCGSVKRVLRRVHEYPPAWCVSPPGGQNCNPGNLWGEAWLE